MSNKVTEAQIEAGADWFGNDEATAWLEMGRILVANGYLRYTRQGDLHSVTLNTRALEQPTEGELRDAYLEGWRTGHARAQGQGPSNTPMQDWVDSMAKVRTAALATKDTPND